MQYARSKVDYTVAEYVYLLPSDMNLQIGKVKNFSNKILISSPSFRIGTNLKISFDGEKDKPDIKPKQKPDIKSNKEHKQDTKPDTDSNKEHKLNIKMMETEPDMNKITYEEEKVALVLGITSIFTVWWMFK